MHSMRYRHLYLRRLAQLINDRCRIVLLLFRGETLTLVEDDLLLIDRTSAFLRLWDRRDEFGTSPILDYPLSRLAA